MELDPEKLNELQETYNKCLKGNKPPNAILTPFGLILRTGKNIIVFDYNEEGDIFILSPEVQKARLKEVEKWVDATITQD